MSVKRLDGASWTDLTVRRRYTSGEWQSMEAGKRFGGGEWHWLWSREHQYVKEYPLTGKQIYIEYDGSKSDYMLPHVTEGSFDGTRYSNLMTLFNFDFAQIVSDTASAVVNSTELYLQRETGEGSNAYSVTAHISYLRYGMSYFPNSYTGGNITKAVSEYPTFGRTEGKWVPLLDSVGTGIQNGSIKMFVLGLPDQTANYGIFPSNSIKLRVTYTVTDG